MLLCGAYKLLYAYTYTLYIYAKISITIQSLSLIIILFFTVCQDSFSEGLFWRTQSAGEVARLRCSEFHPSLRSGVFIGRTCDSDGQWGEIDFTNCTMDLNASPFIHVELQMPTSNFTGSIVNMTRDRVCS